MENVPTFITIHHSAAQEPIPQFNAIDEWHRQRSFVKSSLGFFVGYHRVIEKDGTVVKAREDDEQNNAVLLHNHDSLAVCLVGNFDKEDPTPEQISSLAEVLVEWTTKYNISPLLIYPHRKFGSTSCYGSRLENTWGTLVCMTAGTTKKKARSRA